MISIDALSEIIAYLNRREFTAAGRSDDSHPLFAQGDHVNAHYANFNLSTLLQPIVDIASGASVAHEAFLQARTPAGVTALGHALTAENLFANSCNSGCITYLDRLTRTLHALNFLRQDIGGDLHLNVHPHHMLAVSADHGRVFEAILQQCGLAPRNIVLEVQEHGIRDRLQLARAIAAWQSRGYRIAIDNFDREHIQIERVLRLRPDLIKFDISLLHERALTHGTHALRFMAETVRAAGIRIVATGIETLRQEQIATAIGAQFGQGHWFGRPAETAQPITSDGEKRLA